MTLLCTWIVNGKRLESACAADSDSCWTVMNGQGGVRITAGPQGTELRWVVASPHVASLLRAEAMLPGFEAPFMLRYFAGGCFEERYDDDVSARQRISSLLMHGDRHLVSRIFVTSPDPSTSSIPGSLLEALQENAVPADRAVECRFEPELEGFVVQRVGVRSAIGKIWGTDTFTFPCQANGVLGRNASDSYGRAITQGVPIYEQVIASLRFPDGSLHWAPYHRVIFPIESSRQRRVVQVLSEFAAVDFQVL